MLFIFGIILPLAAFSWKLNGGSIANLQSVTAIAASLAIFIAYLSFRQLNIFPSAASGGYLLLCLMFSYGIIAACMLMLRFDYSRLQLLTSAIASVVISTAIQVFFLGKRKSTFGVISGGRAEFLPLMPNIHWISLDISKSISSDIHGVVVDLRADHNRECDSCIAKYALAGVPIYHAPDVIEQLTGRVEISHLSENTLGSLNPNDIYLQLKSLTDRIVALLLLIILSPLLVIIYILIRVDSEGGALFFQQRMGYRARPFKIYKFRTMIPQPFQSPDNQASLRSAMTTENDPRITRVGRFLRRTRLDELPQLINIFLGEMSFIGPRPEAEQLSAWYEKEIPFYHYRHIIRPGLTGWAQVKQGHVAELEDIRSKLHLDFYYVKNFSFWLDVIITLQTVKIVLTGTGAK